MPGWWPAESGYEVLVGALLIQQSRWQQVERSLVRLRAETGLQPHAIASAPEGALAEWIRPSGFNRQKAVRLRALSRWWSQSGGEDGLGDVATPQLRDALLAQPGIGPETADAILLYAFGRRVFVVDAYLKRLLARTGLGAAATGADLGSQCLKACGETAACSRKAHAQVVVHAQSYCRKQPVCLPCPLAGVCAYAGSSMAASR